MKKNWKLALTALVLTAAISGGVAAFAAGTGGSADDPLVTLSYLNDVFAPSLNDTVDKAVAANEAALKQDLDDAISEWNTKIQGQMGGSGSGSAAYTVVTLSNGQTLTGQVGCEIMLRVGTATCVASGAPGLVDSTGGTTLANGNTLVTNHLYLVTVDTRGVTATADTVKLLVRGSYTIA